MKKSILIIITIFISLNLKAQKGEQALVTVFYKFNHLKDSLNKSNMYKERMVLWIGKNASVYKSYDKIVNDSVKKTSVQDDGKGGYVVNTSNRKKTIENQIFKYPADRKLVVFEKLIKSYAINEDYPNMDWKIGSDTMSISGIKCQKAQTTFKGRNYTAWFAPDLPYNTGPWKLCDLPGLILQAYDDKHEVEFMFDGLKPAISTETINIPGIAIATSPADYKRLVELLRNDPNAFFAQNEVNGVRLVPSKPEVFKNAYKTENNPIELQP
ncbi:GLPGLI family protein [Pedobacter gandavensis]|uniref:GLPGLI family protein n=1 Tax=Pedobacter gandavensis TaxID=2679963 RepID=A0ABR6EVT5_9SPHI|nr:GLPGLI family protein [Pedobacter gandavensis]MBB2148919.1 GLPGLI family protein [Pedobacter gandavensis]